MCVNKGQGSDKCIKEYFKERLNEKYLIQAIDQI